jgi:EAL domain-containing protein (putative c-di-GMP-specific phosphodiesterase class I)
MTNELDCGFIMDSISVPITIISSVSDAKGQINDFKIEYVNKCFSTKTKGSIYPNQKISEFISKTSLKMNQCIEGFFRLQEHESCNFFLFFTCLKINFFITANKIKKNCCVLTLTSLASTASYNTNIPLVKSYKIMSHNNMLSKKLSAAVMGKDFELYFQPQFFIQSNALRGFEALIRWHDIELGPIGPDCFIPIAEKSHFIVRLGWWILETAVSVLKIWQEKFGFEGVLSVNISPVQLQEKNFVANFSALIKRYNIQPNSLEIEITEAVFIDDLEKVKKIFNCIRKENVLISLDDFGTGYSSFSYLECLPVSTLKIDKSLVDSITYKNRKSAHIINSVIKLGNKLGIETIAEGVEYEDQLAILSSMKCKIVQGFLRGIPIDRNNCEQMLALIV